MIDNARQDAFAQADPEADGQDGFSERYPTAAMRDFDGNPAMISEMDALIAYLQMLGTSVDFSTYQADSPANKR
jgi:cytochrome c oxidase cbb3-type subunit 2